MHRATHGNGLQVETSDVPSTASVSSDRNTLSPTFSLVSVPSVSPEPAYVAAAAASNIVTGEFQTTEGWYEGAEYASLTETALVSAGSLALVNAFLDRLLFNFLSCAHSTSLASLRPAVVEVLKPRLAKEAIAGADEELQEYLGGDDDELDAFHEGQDAPSEWDLQLVWRRTRLRCMVYTRLGDMEEEDEELYIQQDHLEETSITNPPSKDVGIVSPAAAIFLTSILEFVGEHALMIAAQAAYRRYESNSRNNRAGSDDALRITVEETDMEKVALNPTLGRLWRTWRKQVRTPRTSISRILARDARLQRPSSNSASRKSSIGTADGNPQILDLDSERRRSLHKILNEPDPTSIPLPPSDYDVAEIEVPGYLPNVLPRSLDLNSKRLHNRPFSMIIPSAIANDPDTHAELNTDIPYSPDTATHNKSIELSTLSRRSRRAYSLSTPEALTFTIIPGDRESGLTSTTPTEEVVGTDKDLDAPSARGGDDTPRPTDHRKLSEPRALQDSLASYKKRQLAAAPTSSPFQGSVLNAISKHAARQLDHPSSGAGGDASEPDMEDGDDLGDEHEPGASELRFDRNDYEIDESEHVANSVQSSITPLVKASDNSDISAIPTPKEGTITRHRDSSSTPSNQETFTTAAGEVSPMEYSPIHSHDVSPIEVSEDESPSLSQIPKTLRRHVSNSEPSPTDQAREVAPPLGYTSPHSMQYRQRRKEEPIEDYALAGSVRTSRTSDASSLSGKDLQVDGTILNRQQNVTPMLAPLRETAIAAPDASDESSSPNPSPAGRTQATSYGGRTTPVASVSDLQEKVTRAGNNHQDLRQQLPAAYPEPNRPNPYRGSPVSAGVQDLPAKYIDTRTTNRDVRPPAFGSNSITPPSSRPKRKVGSLSGESFQESMRSSNDGNKGLVERRNSRSSTSHADREQSFEQLMKSNETIQYTLTPQSMREIEESEVAPRTSSNSYRSNSKVGNMLRNGRSSQDQNRPPSGRTSTMNANRELNGLHSHPVNVQIPTRDKNASYQQNSIFKPGVSSKRASAAVPRDARVEKDSVGDFADFIRSTGPEQPKGLPKGQMSPPDVGSRQSPAGGRGPKSPKSPHLAGPNRSSLGASPVASPKLGDSTKSRGNRLQARDPTVGHDGETSELIDFLRQGPPIDRNIEAIAQGRSRDTNSLASTQDSIVAKSIQSSVNSRTGLMESANRQNAKALPSPNGPKRIEESGFPQRTHRRAKDPYAIDSDSEEEGDDDSIDTRRPRQEESLLDFLNSVPPPQAELSPPPVDVRRNTGLQRKLSAAAMRARFSRTGSASSGRPASSLTKAPSSSSMKSPSTSSMRSPVSSSIKSPNQGPPSSQSSRIRGAPPQPLALVRDSPPKVQRQPNPRDDAYRTTSSAYSTPQSERLRKAAPPRAIARSAQPRSPREEVGGMGDLSDFLKNSGPPETEAPTLTPPSPVKEEGGFSRMFSRRKRGEMA